MKKLIFVLCLTIVLTSCSLMDSDTSEMDYMQYASEEVDTSESDEKVMGSVETEMVTEEETVTTPETVVTLSDEELNGLDNTEIGYGQGRNVDNNNVPLGATDFNNQYNQYNAYAVVPDVKDEIYLTFDEGYEYGFTSKILDILKEKDVKAVFFLTGDYVRSQPELVQRMIDEGHVLGNHGNKHKSLPQLSLEDGETELQDCYNLVKEKFGYKLKLQRPPCGTYSERSLALSQRLGYTTCLWSFAYKDWEVDNQPNPEEAYKRITEAAHSGGIFLLHPVSQTNTDILGRVIDNFKEQGYNVTTPKI